MKGLAAILLLCLLASMVKAQDSVTTLAGQALVRGAANGTSTNAQFNDPAAIITDVNGNLFVADSQNHAIREITTNGFVTRFCRSVRLSRHQRRHGHQRAVQYSQRTGL